MSLPWVSRLAYDHVRGTCRAVERLLEEERTETKRLTNIIVGMQRDGFHPVALMPTEVPQREDDLPGPVLDALDEIGITGSQLEQHKQWARRRLTKEKNAEIVAEELLAGGLVAEEAEG